MRRYAMFVIERKMEQAACLFMFVLPERRL